MSSSVERLENNKATITITVDAATFEKGIAHAYNKNKSKINMPGFRPGRVPRKMIEMQYGKSIFYDDAVDFVFPEVYRDAVKSQDLNVVSRPELMDMDVNDNGEVTLKVGVTLKPQASVNKYEGLGYKPVSDEVTEEEIQAEVDKARDKNARTFSVETPIENGDTAVIDFEGFLDDVAFEGGKGEGFELVIGSHSFIDTFEDQLVGKTTGDSVTVNVTFPTEYHAENLAGKPARFEVKINEVKRKELPACDDDFAQDVSDFDTFEAYKADILEKLSKQKKEQAQTQKENQVMEALLGELVCDVPEVMIENQAENMVNNMAQRMSAQGIDFNLYLQYMGQSVEEFRQGQMKTAETNVKLRLALEAVTESANITVTDEEFDEEIAKMSQMYGMEKEKLLDLIHEDEKAAIVMDIKVEKAIKYVVDNAVVINE